MEMPTPIVCTSPVSRAALTPKEIRGNCERIAARTFSSCDSYPYRSAARSTRRSRATAKIVARSDGTEASTFPGAVKASSASGGRPIARLAWSAARSRSLSAVRSRDVYACSVAFAAAASMSVASPASRAWKIVSADAAASSTACSRARHAVFRHAAWVAARRAALATCHSCHIRSRMAAVSDARAALMFACCWMSAVMSQDTPSPYALTVPSVAPPEGMSSEALSCGFGSRPAWMSCASAMLRRDRAERSDGLSMAAMQAASVGSIPSAGSIVMGGRPGCSPSSYVSFSSVSSGVSSAASTASRASGTG
jgi:hypothetical protein